MHIVTLNTRGLHSQLKRRHLFQSLNKYSISCLQETFITDDTCSLWSSEWNGDFFYQSGSSHSKGLIILINKNFKVDNLNVIKINDRCLGITFSLLNKPFYIFNIYAPADKEKRVPFFKDLPSFLKLNELPLDAYISICGDMNSVASNTLDVLTGNPHPAHEISIFNDFIQQHDLTDCWRKLNPNNKDFSWVRFNSKNSCFKDTVKVDSCVARRLDYIFCNSNLTNSLKSSDMSHLISSDHKLVTAHFLIDDYPTGPSTWHFNESLLDHDSFITHMRSFILKHIRDTNLEKEYDKRLSWDLLKIGIRDECMFFSRKKKLESNLSSLNSDILLLNKELITNPHSTIHINLLKKKILEKEIYELSEAKGALKRSRVHHIDQWEKNTKLFLGIEKSRQNNTTIKSLYNSDKELVETPSLITCTISAFYKNLLNAESDPSNTTTLNDLNIFMDGLEHPTLNEEEKNVLDLPLNINELDSALKLLNKDSAPGVDGLTPLFYIHFWDVLKQPLFECFNEAVTCKTLSLSQRRAIISLLPKGTPEECDLNDLGSWRPISLTCTDYKLYSKILALRMQTVIKKLIHINQVGYISGRSISDHLRLIDDVIHFSDCNNIPGILTSLDFKKAFDSVSKCSIRATLGKFGFGPMFLNYVDTILNETEASVKNGGWLSEWFKTTRGVRQGCVLSPLLFILVVECLAIKIRSDNSIIGLLDGARSLPERGIRLIQYADDISMFLKSGACLSRALSIIDDFRIITGLTLNRKKSIAMCLGGYTHDNDEDEGLKWLEPNENMRILGVFFNAKREASTIKENWLSKIDEVKKLISSWSRRSTTLIGRSIVAKTFMLSRINHIIQSLVLPDSIIDIIDNLIFKFLWMKTDIGKKSIERVKRSTLVLPVEEGGIGMISIRDQQDVMLLRWLHRGCRTDLESHHSIINFFFRHVGGIEYVLKCDANYMHFKGLTLLSSTFWQKALSVWIKFDKSNYKNDAFNIPIFNNSLFLYQGAPLLIQQWIRSGVVLYHQLIKDRNNGQIKTFHEICQIIRPYGGLFLDYLAVKNAIWQYNTSQQDPHISNDNAGNSDMACIFKLNNKSLRLALTKQRQKGATLNCTAFWVRKYNIDIAPYFIVAFKATRESKLRALQFKLIHNFYPSNVLLHKMKIKNTNICDFCQEVDFIEHMFVTCIRLKSFWDIIRNIVEQILEQEVRMICTTALLGILKGNVICKKEKLNEANHVILLAKFCIVKAKYTSNPNIQTVFEHELSLRRKYFPSLQEH